MCKEVKMHQAAEGKVPPKRKKVKTAVHAIFELLNRPEEGTDPPSVTANINEARKL